MTSNKIATNIVELEPILLCAFRYCLGRETAASSVFISYITQSCIWNSVSNDLKRQILEEIQQYKQMHNVKEHYMEEWNDLAIKIIQKLN